MRIKYQHKFQEETLAIFSNKKSPDIAILGGIEIEHIVNSNNNINIKTEVGGKGGRLALCLKNKKILPTIFAFLGNDEYLNFITDHFNKQNIPLTWSISKNKNLIKLRIIEEQKTYYDNKEVTHSINPVFFEEFLYNMKNVYISTEKWNIDLIEYIKYKTKNLFVSMDYNYSPKNIKFSCDYLFVFSDKNGINKKYYENIESKKKIYFEKNKIFVDDKEYIIEEKPLYFDEAITAFQSSFITSKLRLYDDEESIELALDLYKRTLKLGNTDF